MGAMSRVVHKWAQQGDCIDSGSIILTVESMKVEWKDFRSLLERWKSKDST